MSGGWLERDGRAGLERRELAGGLTRWGGQGAELPCPASGSDQVQLWDQPPRLVFIGRGPRPRVDGREVEECDLSEGARVEWQGERWTFRAALPRAALEEVALAPSVPAVATPAPQRAEEELAWRRLRAGLCAELGHSESSAVRRCQERIARGDYDADRCADELLGAQPMPVAGEKLERRAAELERDLIMSSLSRGGQATARKARSAARHTFAFALVQGLALLMFALALAALLLLARARMGVSIDAWIDRFLAWARSGS